MTGSPSQSPGDEPTRRRFRLTLAYRGTDFHGWQFQDEVRTVEGVVREALTKISSEPVMTAGASRTDRGVHALGQCCLCELVTRLPAAQLRRAIQAHTPLDVSVREVEEVGPEFHPRFDALEKLYLYRIRCADAPSPFGQDLHWSLGVPLDLDAMVRGAKALVGRHDFEAFRNASKDATDDAVRTVRQIHWAVDDAGLMTCQVIGDGFLYKMVRNLVGTLVEVGRGRRNSDSMGEVLRSRDRRRAGQTAPPEGLFLMKVRYSAEPELEPDHRPWIPV